MADIFTDIKSAQIWEWLLKSEVTTNVIAWDVDCFNCIYIWLIALFSQVTWMDIIVCNDNNNNVITPYFHPNVAYKSLGQYIQLLINSIIFTINDIHAHVYTMLYPP